MTEGYFYTGLHPGCPPGAETRSAHAEISAVEELLLHVARTSVSKFVHHGLAAVVTGCRVREQSLQCDHFLAKKSKYHVSSIIRCFASNHITYAIRFRKF